MWLGVDYYPEQWDSSMIDADMDNIVELGANVIRIGEFAWHLMEKNENGYDFSFFDMVIKKAEKKGLKVIFGTPTATAPAWLIKKYPDVLSEFENGQKRKFGGRHTCCYNNEMYKLYSDRIVEKLIEHYKDEKNIVAWQLDNEFGHEGSDECFCKSCEKEFQEYLRKKFDNDIDKLNYIYGTSFWSQEYNDFDEIPVPSATITTHNPALRLDWERFRSESIVKYSNRQVEIIRKYIPDAVIMHDFPGGGLDKHVDYAELSKKLDIVAFNNYPVWGGQKKPIPPYEIAFGLDYIRGLKKQNFWITEGIMGAQGHDITGYLPRPNQAKMWSYQGMGRGAETFIYFRYRGAIRGAEQFCYGVIDADNQKRRKFFEVQDFFNTVKKYEKYFKTPITNEIAMVYDYDSLASFRIQRQSILLDCHSEMKKIHKLFFNKNINIDIIPHTMDLSQYKIVILPFMIIWKEEFSKKITEFVKNGGKLILTYRNAVKDIDNNLTLGEMLPVKYKDLAGVYIEETESLQEYNELPLLGENEFSNIKGTGGIFRDMLVPTTAKTLFKYADKFYDKFSAITVNQFEKGEVYYIGCGAEENIMNLIVDKVINDINIDGISTPDSVEMIKRGDKDDYITLYINHNDYEVEINGEILKPYGVIIKK